jgi:hypothetical protein
MAATADSPTGDMAETDVLAGYDDVPEADNFFKVLPSFLFDVDEVNGKAADLTDCQFVKMSRLSRRFELRELYGDKVTKNLEPKDGREWSDPVRWWHKLESGSVTEKDFKARGGASNDDDLLQEDIWWCTPASVANWKAPKPYEHPCGFKIKQGQTIAEAFKAKGKEFVGLYLVMCGKRILYIDTESHNDVVVSGLWLMNGASFYGKGQQELNDIQEAANAFFSMFYEYGMHSSMPQRVYDGGMFDRKGFKNRAGGMTPTRKGFARQHPIRWYIDTLEPGRMSSDMYFIWSSLISEGGQEIGGTPKAVTGQGDPKQRTLGGQALLAQRGLSLLIPSQKSAGQALKRFARQQLKLAQRYWGTEQIKRTLSRVDQSWEEQDVEAFRAMDIDRDLTYKIVEGSDIPVTFAEKEARVGNAIATGILWNPQIPVELRQQVARFANIDFDPDNIERERRHQSQVLRKIKEACAYVEKQGIGYVQTEAGIELNPLAIDRILSLPGLEILPRSENLKFAKQYFDNEIVAQHTSEHPDQLLLAVLERRVDMLIQQQVTNDADTAKIMGQLNQDQQGGGQPGPDPAAQGEIEAMKLDHQRDTEMQMQKMKHEQAVELEKIKMDNARETEVNAKIPDQPPA